MAGTEPATPRAPVTGAAPPAVRLATRADLPGIFAIYDREVLQGTCTFETEPRPPAERDAWFNAHAPERFALLVATAGPDHAGAGVVGGILGWAGMSPWSPRPAYARTAETSVYVHASARGRGVGRRLMEALVAHALAHTPARVLVARIVVPNDASVRLHESLGYARIGTMRRCGEKFGRILDVLLMDRHLDRPRAGPA